MIDAPPPLLAVIGGRVANGVWTMDAIPSDASELIAGRGWAPVEIVVEAETEKPDVLRLLGDAGRFPGYYGANWDAASDCLTDLSWLTGGAGIEPGVVVVIRGANEWAIRHDQDASILLDILGEAAAWWERRDRPFFTVWEGRRLPLPSLDLL